MPLSELAVDLQQNAVVDDHRAVALLDADAPDRRAFRHLCQEIADREAAAEAQRAAKRFTVLAGRHGAHQPIGQRLVAGGVEYGTDPRSLR